MCDRFHQTGERVLRFYVMEHIFAKFPELPQDALESVEEAYVGFRSLATVAQNLGVDKVMLWKGTDDPNFPEKTQEAVSGRVLLSVIGAYYKERGTAATKEFIKLHFLSRTVELEGHLNLEKPMYVLLELTKALAQPKPIARLLKESGRYSSNPVYVVGMFIGAVKIGEAYGSSIRMAEHRAARDALQRHYMTEVKNVVVPSDWDEDSLTFVEDTTE
ncbi:hypothetical protein BDK51DRAFT_22218 [Blyttiomyces helicus]|uniref:Large ribosomal subunit protein mL44 n=1 Tax=Blyttiomyces helicus TaxID=388810 RepID=A0A4P9W152_9FUNG|nr:hypothetical protein BDK51DRAFT_22218 [Blyttiomyces helicus]|eukprot:RKO85901.1 hypothetical protein BDK51DRAFT_22218 [Blyttiomyces helicus]